MSPDSSASWKQCLRHSLSAQLLVVVLVPWQWVWLMLWTLSPTVSHGVTTVGNYRCVGDDGDDSEGHWAGPCRPCIRVMRDQRWHENDDDPGPAFILPLMVHRKANPQNKSQSPIYFLDNLTISQRNSSGFWKSQKKTNPQNKNQSPIYLPTPIGRKII